MLAHPWLPAVAAPRLRMELLMRLALLTPLCVLCALCGESLAADPAPWATYRGNPQRTGNTDNVAGPEKPAILWSVKSTDHFIASPVPVKDSVYVAGVGAFNRPSAHLFPFAASQGVDGRVSDIDWAL